MLPTIKLTSLPRMADFAMFGEAASRALGYPPETFLNAYRQNRAAAHELILEDSVVARAIRKLMETKSRWEGTATELLAEIKAIVAPAPQANANGGVWQQQVAGKPNQKPSRDGDLPKTGRGLAGALRRLAPALRGVGIAICFGRDGAHSNKRRVTIEAAPDFAGVQPSAPSASSAADTSQDLNGQCLADGCSAIVNPDRPQPSADRPQDPVRTIEPSASGPTLRTPSAKQVDSGRTVTSDADRADDADGPSPKFSPPASREVFEL
jgi:hypothetical protein